MLIAVSTLAASVPYQNDGGSGGDASDVQAAPTLLPDYGSYSGTSRSVNDADWYGVTNATTAMAPACVVLDAGGDTFESVSLGMDAAGGSHAVTATMVNDSTVRLAIAGVAPTTSRVGFVPAPNPAGNTPARPGSYQFTVRGYTLADLGQGDAGLGSSVDAPAWPNGLPLAGACTRGQLMPVSGLGDASDAYAFTLTQASQIVYSLGANGAMTLSVLDSAGQAIPGSTILPGQIGNLTLPAGTFSMNAASTSGASTIDYVFSWIGGGDPTTPCRPYCTVS